MTDETRKCTGCEEEKPVSGFSVRGRRDGQLLYRSRCKECQATQARGWYHGNKEQARATTRSRNLRKDFGLTENEYAALLEKQNGVCAICDQPERAHRNGVPNRLSVDHCHRTGAIRGLLCHACNRALGLFDDNIERMESAFRYLTAEGN